MNDILTAQDTFYDLLSDGINPAYRYDARQFINFLKSGNYGFELEALTAWRDYLMKQGYKARTINHKLLISKLAFKRFIGKAGNEISYQKRQEILSAIGEIRGPKPPRPAVENKILTEAEIIMLLDNIEESNPEMSLMIEFLWKTGLRISEMLSIKLTDCKQISRSIIEIRIIGKGGRERSTWIDSDFYRVLKRYFRPVEYLFQRGKKPPRSRSYVSMNIKRICTRILDRRNLSAHSLRHSYATHGLEKGRSLQWVSQSLGHSDIQTTSRYYAHIQVKASDVIETVRLTRERKIA